MQPNNFTSNKPYLFRAIFDWLLDNQATPHILVDVTKPEVSVPNEHVKNDQIVLNINPSAVHNYHFDGKVISFSASFSGVAREIYVPIAAVLAVYAQENGLGMAFSQESSEDNLSLEKTVERVNPKPTVKEEPRLKSPSVLEEEANHLDQKTKKGAIKKGTLKKNRSHLTLIK